MAARHTPVHRDAILIGINAYTDDNGRPAPLKGCVHDVEEISNELRRLDPSNNVSIHAFTATASRDYSPLQPACEEPKESWPTYDNISSCLDRVTQKAQSGDHVYIHYSGHSTVLPPSEPYSSWDRGHLALVLLEGPTASETRYFHSIEIAERLRDMVNKGLEVTMVLDCCYSGSTLRNDDAVRFVPYCAAVDKKYPPRQSKRVSHGQIPEQSKSPPSDRRRASMLANWLANPDGYAILTASDATEKAFDVRFKDGRPHGTLTYFLLKTFDMLGGVGGSMQQLYESIDVTIKDYRCKQQSKTQSPVLFGNEKQFFFGRPLPGCSGDIPITVITVSGKPELRLHAGSAHGISKGDQFNLYPLGGSTDAANEAIVTAEVVNVRGITSDLRVVKGKSSSVKTGWLATAMTRLSLQQFPVRLNVFEKHLPEWQQGLRQRISLEEYCPSTNGSGPCGWSFTVNQISDTVYNIEDESNQALTTLAVTGDLDRTMDKLLNQVQHLASFKLVRDLVNKARSIQFTESYSVYLVKENGRERSRFYPGCPKTNIYDACAHPDCVLTVSQNDKVGQNDKVSLHVVNKCPEPDGPSLFLYVYALGSDWEIDGILEASREEVPPRGSGGGIYQTTGAFELKIDFTLEQGQDQCEDVIKVFLTAQPSSFTTLELPKIGQDPRRASPEIQGKRGYSSSEDWAVLTFRVRLVLEDLLANKGY
ncbi:hypothetical protein F5Y03DRAFT_321744 [Xylaria venustula]|nr:hypothetical protein F5Y03DRAFT_321744 [Xylaria venustula]